MELSRAPRLALTSGRAGGASALTSEPGGGAAGGRGGRGGAGGMDDAPAVEGGVGDDGDVKGELAPEPELFELLYLAECSSPLSLAERFDFFRAKIFLFFFSSSEP